MNKSIIRLVAMVMIGIGVLVIAVSVRDLWRSSANIAHASNNAGNLVAIPTNIAPIVTDFVVEVK